MDHLTQLRRILSRPWLWLGIGLAVVAVRGLFIDLMDVDSSQYASISMEMLQNGSWLQVQHRGSDYLDKPPLLFWLSATSFSLFGLNNWAYKLPSLLAALAGIWAVYRFSKLFYPEKTARCAAFILASSIGLFIMCNDVRTDTLLLGTTACAVWQLAEYLQYNRWKNLLAGFFFIGLAMLAKGPIGLVIPVFAVGSHLLLRRDWRAVFRWQWLAGLGVTALMLAPMCWGLWQQFDLHPEKTVNEQTGVSGLYFFFWEQSFGRITGENVWKNESSALYFLYVYLWAFLPWALPLPWALWDSLRGIFQPRQDSRKMAEAFSLGCFLLTFIALSMSRYKLPHYIFVTLPWAAVLVARGLSPTIEHVSAKRIFIAVWAALYVAVGAMLVAAFLLVFWVFPEKNALIGGIFLAATGSLLFKIVRKPFSPDFEILVQRGVWVSIIAGFMLNFHFCPRLLPFQSTSAIAQFARKTEVSAENMAFFRRHGHALDFYSGHILTDMKTTDQIRQTAQQPGGLWIYTDEAGRRGLEAAGVRFEEAIRTQHFQAAGVHVSASAVRLPQFLDPDTRAHVLEPVFLLKILSE